MNDFLVPVPDPEEAEQRTIDIKEAQHGEDQGTAGSTAAAEAEQAKVAQAAEELEKQRQAALERDARQQADEQAREQAAQLAAQQRELAMAEQLKAAQQKAEQLAVQQRAEQLAVQQRAEQLAVQQKAEQQRAEQQRAEQEAAQQGERERASAPASQAPTGGATAGAGGAGGRITVPKNMLGSDLNRRAKELVKGLDLLRGDPPPARMRDERRITVGSTERDLPLRMFALSWGQKIERNGNLNYPRTWAEGVRVDPLVSVALRSDGSVDDVTIIRSSGRADIDEAVRRIVRLNERYSSFPPNIASRYDVIEIRRVWRFGEALKLLEEAR